jgi:hypothetical protein
MDDSVPDLNLLITATNKNIKKMTLKHYQQNSTNILNKSKKLVIN